MKMKKFKSYGLIALFALTTGLTSCKNNRTDAEIQTDVNTKIADEAGSSLTASVNKGEVTLSGTCKDAECKRECAEEVKGVKGVKNVVNNITVAEPITTAPVEITSDGPLQEAVNNVLKEYKDVKAEVKDGVVTLRGEITRDRLTGLIAAVNALQPKRVDNQLAIK